MEEMTVVVLGHVDHGKSTLVGRLLYDTGQVQSDRIEFARRRSAEQGRELEFAFLLDGLAEEQEQGITIDFTQIQFRTDDRDFVIADAPGHREFLKNMLSGSSQAEAAFLLIDATEGIQEQSRRHAYLLSLLGITQVAIVVNKMDLVDWSESVFQSICQEYKLIFDEIAMNGMAFIPASAYLGDNIAKRSANLSWYDGPTVMEQFGFFQPISVKNDILRFSVQDVYRFGQSRLLAGRIDFGQMAVGQEVIVWPTGEKTVIKKIDCWPKTEVMEAGQGDCIGLELSDALFVERGMILTELSHKPNISRCFKARVVWLGRSPLMLGQRYKLRVGFQETGAYVERFDRVIDIGNLRDVNIDHVPAGFVGEGTIVVDQPLVYDCFSKFPETGRFVLIDGYQIAGGGIILMPQENDTQVFNGFSHEVQNRPDKSLFPELGNITRRERCVKNKHDSLTVWLTGLSGAGKSTLARQLEKRFFEAALQTYVLDGDNIRGGLNKDLDFSASGRSENIRRIGEVSKLFVDAGFVTITAFISPYQKDRRQVRALFDTDDFVEVFVKCSLAVCESRDIKGLYAKARQGFISQFTGVDDVYEEPEQAEIVVDTEQFTVDECVEQIISYLKAHYLKGNY